MFKHSILTAKKLAHNLELRPFSKLTVMTDNQKCPILLLLSITQHIIIKGKVFPVYALRSKWLPPYSSTHSHSNSLHATCDVEIWPQPATAQILPNEVIKTWLCGVASDQIMNVWRVIKTWSSAGRRVHLYCLSSQTWRPVVTL